MLNSGSAFSFAPAFVRRSKSPLYYRKLQVQADQSALAELVFILRQHQHQTGWVLLVAPNQLPDKSRLAACGVDLSRVLLIQQKQISNIDTVLAYALASSTCAAVVVWQDQFSEQSLYRYQDLAELHQTCFYQLSTLDEQPVFQNTTH
ncbi:MULTISPECIES: SulA-like leucine-rich domain-containing protein [Rheinheimera]|uniref:SulA-like leucine-rich domain-containing protein n=1 Tax=Rheinheimera marina TaxID=1774958 RepID=A0ABV9JQW9_9GAMM